MAVGSRTIDRVAAVLSTDKGLRPQDVRAILGREMTSRAVRYALKALVDSGRAWRTAPMHEGDQDRRYFAGKGSAFMMREGAAE